MAEIKQEEIQRLDAVYHKLFYLDLTSENAMPAAMQGLSSVEIGIISMVSGRPDIILREISETMKLPNSTLTSALNRLERKGLAERVISPRDRRSFGIALTEKGVAAHAAHLQFEENLWLSILSKLESNDEREQFLALAEKIVAGFIKGGEGHD